jgi:hypothetical protein
MLATCDNCQHGRTGSCALKRTPKAGEVLCEAYAMSERFRGEVLDMLRADVERQFNSVFQRFRVETVDPTQTAA